jgi:tRNA(Ile)-lysidine synthetase-like protein
VIQPVPRATYRFFQAVTNDLSQAGVLPSAGTAGCRQLTDSCQPQVQTRFASALTAAPQLPISEQTTIIAGVSGGVDSMLMLAYLLHLRQQVPFQLAAAHLNHGLRGSAADRDQAVVEEFCRAQQVICHVRQTDVSSLAKARGQGVEEAGRAARFAFFQDLGTQTQLEFQQDYLVALAHHEQDQAETILLNLGRGSGLSGLTGMAILRGRLLRPFLHRSKAEIEAAARAAGIPWAVDQTNLEPDYRRNRLRNELLPLWQEIVGSDLTPQLARLAQNLREEVIALETAAAELYQRALLPDGTLSTKVLRRAPQAVSARALNLGLNEAVRRHLDNSTTLSETALPKKLQDQLWLLCWADTAALNTLDLQKGIKAEVYANTLRFSFDGSFDGRSNTDFDSVL